MDAATGLPHNFSIPNFSLDGDSVHSQPRSDLPFGANLDSLPPDALLSRGFDSQNLMTNYVGGHRDIETELSAAADISPQSFGMPVDMSFKPGCSNDNIAAKDANGVVGNGLWGNQTTQRMRTYTKVQKRGSVGRTIDVTRYKGYEELRHDLARMFGIEGQLEGMEWKLVYVDHENDILLVGDDPWEEFVSCVQSIKILSYSEVQKMSLDGDLGGNVPAAVPNPASSGTDSGNPWRAAYDDNSAASFNR
ncbi:auxin response factor 19 [Tanacetum coccineum]